ncbi:MAG TPA: hypothetical protein PKD86_18690, partial [Gemmatales bacterium]|nr:hypothetical protein [Gemmatales bacterium]
HVGLAMKDVDGAYSLFANKLRLPVADGPGGRRQGFGVQAGGTMLRVAPAEAPEHVLGRLGVNHLAIRVKSLEATRQRLTQIGVRLSADQPPGTVVAIGKDHMHVACGAGSLLALLAVQPEGKKVLTAGEFLRGYRVDVGARFG